MLSQVLWQFQNIESMEWFFLECGHTQNENYSIHSVIEQNKKGVSIYHPYWWITLIEIFYKSRPYIIQPIRQEDYVNFQIDMNGMYKFLINKSRKEVGGELIGMKSRKKIPSILWWVYMKNKFSEQIVIIMK